MNVFIFLGMISVCLGAWSPSPPEVFYLNPPWGSTAPDLQVTALQSEVDTLEQQNAQQASLIAEFRAREARILAENGDLRAQLALQTEELKTATARIKAMEMRARSASPRGDRKVMKA